MSYVSIALLGAIWGTEYLQAQGLSQSSAADMVSIAWLGYAVACPLLGAISDFSKRRKPALIFCAILGFFSTSLITYLPLGQHIWAYTVLFFLLGVAASGQNIGFATISEHVDLSTRATALGMNNGVIMLFSAVIPPIVSYFIMQASGGASHHLQANDFIRGFTLMPIMYVIGILIAFFLIRETYCKPQKELIKLNPNV